MRRNIYIELPRQDHDVLMVRRWPNSTRRFFEHPMLLSYRAPSVYWNEKREIAVVVHVDDSMCTGSTDELHWLFDSIKEQYDLKRHVLEPDSTKDVKHLSRLLEQGGCGIEWERDPQDAKALVRECGMSECKWGR